MDDDRNPLDVLAEEFAAQCRRGITPSVSEYAARYPDLAAEIQELLPAVAMMEQLKPRPSEALPPERLGDYHILRELGRGGMGIVYEAEHKALGRRVALKVAPHASLDPIRLERFQREAQAAARLHHTNIVPIFAVGNHEGLPYFVMQYISGCGLNAILSALKQKSRSLKLPGGGDLTLVPYGNGNAYWHWVARIGAQIADALQYAHDHGTLHRDIKPANILIDADGTAWIVDFGLAKVADRDDLTRTGDIVGTLQYLAPEAMQGNGDARSDVYGLSLVLYELLTLNSPFGQRSTIELLRHMTEHDPQRPRQINAAIPVELETIVLKGGARNPSDRYKSAALLAEDLRRFLADEPIAARPIGRIERAWRWCRRHRLVSALAAVAMLSMTAAFVAGWVGYVTTTDALARESQRRRDADAANERSEANVRMSLRAFEEIFTVINPFDPVPPPPPNKPGGKMPPKESEENAKILQSVLRFYDQFSEENAGHAALRFEAAKAHGRVGELYWRAGDGEKAEKTLRRALSMAETLDGEVKETDEYIAFASRAHQNLGAALIGARRGKDAEDQFRRAIAMQRKLLKLRPNDPDQILLYSVQRMMLAEMLNNSPRWEEAKTMVLQSIDDLEAALKRRLDRRMENHQSLQYRLLGRILNAHGDHDGADEAFRRAEEIGPPPPPRDGDRPPRHDDDRPPPRQDRLPGPQDRPRPPNPPPRHRDFRDDPEFDDRHEFPGPRPPNPRN